MDEDELTRFYAAIWGPAKVDVSASGTLIYETGSSDSGVVALQWLEQDGRTRPLLAKTGNYGRPSLSPGFAISLLGWGSQPFLP